MTVNSWFPHSGTPGPPGASPRYSSARTGISLLKAAPESRATIPGVLTFTRLPPHNQPGKRLLATWAVLLSLARQLETYWVCVLARRNSTRAGLGSETFPPHSDQYPKKQLPSQSTAA